MVKTYKSKAMAALHENVSDLYRVGMIDKKTMRKFDSDCLTPVRKAESGSYPAYPRQSRRKPSRLCRSFKRYCWRYQQVGTRRENSKRPRSKTAHTGVHSRYRSHSLMKAVAGETISQSLEQPGDRCLLPLMEIFVAVISRSVAFLDAELHPKEQARLPRLAAPNGKRACRGSSICGG